MREVVLHARLVRRIGAVRLIGPSMRRPLPVLISLQVEEIIPLDALPEIHLVGRMGEDERKGETVASDKGFATL